MAKRDIVQIGAGRSGESFPSEGEFQQLGRLLKPDQVAAHIFHGQVRGRWVLEKAPGHLRVWVGKKVCYWEADMVAWAMHMKNEAPLEGMG